MAEDFFGELGRRIAKITQGAVDKTGALVESNRINSKITGEQKIIAQLYQQIGLNMVLKSQAGEIELDESSSVLAGEIEEHREKIREYRENLAAVKGMKICPSCGELIPREVAFCPKCGVATPVPVIEEAAEETDEAFEEVSEETDAADGEVGIEDVAESAGPCCAEAAEQEKAAGDAGEEGSGEAADAVFRVIDGEQ